MGFRNPHVQAQCYRKREQIVWLSRTQDEDEMMVSMQTTTRSLFMQWLAVSSSFTAGKLCRNRQLQ